MFNKTLVSPYNVQIKDNRNVNYAHSQHWNASCRAAFENQMSVYNRQAGYSFEYLYLCFLQNKGEKEAFILPNCSCLP